MDVTSWTIFVLAQVAFASNSFGMRKKRHLGFPKGSAFTITIAISTFLPKNVHQGIAHILEFDFGYPFPDEVAIDRTAMAIPKPTNKRRPRKENILDKERENVILQLEDTLTSFGHNGPACVSRFQCELRYLVPGTSLLEDILLLWFPVSTFSEETCDHFTNECPFSLLHIILHSEAVEEPNLMW